MMWSAVVEIRVQPGSCRRQVGSSLMTWALSFLHAHVLPGRFLRALVVGISRCDEE
jgi:hypothetical protein